MRSSTTLARPRTLAAALLAAVVAFAVLFMLTSAPSGHAAGTVTYKTAQNAELGKKILVTSKGITLYTLSADKNGKVTCTGACASAWPPAILKGGAKPVGVRGLGQVRRSDGKMQATYKGHPLYRYSGDSAKGDVNGDGLPGVWHVVTVK